MKNKRKTLVLIGNDKGGCTKSTSCGTVADALQTLGYTVKLASGDQTNRTLRKLRPDTTLIDIYKDAELNKFMASIPLAKEDVVFLDLPATSGKRMKTYFDAHEFQIFQESGIRLVMAITLTQHPDPIDGAIIWMETFLV